MRYILIDTENKRIKEIYGPGRGSGSTEDEARCSGFLQRKVGGFMQFAHIFENADVLHIGAKGPGGGNIEGATPFFINGIRQGMPGNGIICGLSRDGEYLPATSKVEDIEKEVRFL